MPASTAGDDGYLRWSLGSAIDGPIFEIYGEGRVGEGYGLERALDEDFVVCYEVPVWSLLVCLWAAEGKGGLTDYSAFFDCDSFQGREWVWVESHCDVFVFCLQCDCVPFE